MFVETSKMKKVRAKEVQCYRRAKEIEPVLDQDEPWSKFLKLHDSAAGYVDEYHELASKANGWGA